MQARSEFLKTNSFVQDKYESVMSEKCHEAPDRPLEDPMPIAFYNREVHPESNAVLFVFASTITAQYRFLDAPVFLGFKLYFETGAVFSFQDQEIDF